MGFRFGSKKGKGSSSQTLSKTKATEEVRSTCNEQNNKSDDAKKTQTENKPSTSKKSTSTDGTALVRRRSLFGRQQQPSNKNKSSNSQNQQLTTKQYSQKKVGRNSATTPSTVVASPSSSELLESVSVCVLNDSDDLELTVGDASPGAKTLEQKQQEQVIRKQLFDTTTDEQPEEDDDEQPASSSTTPERTTPLALSRMATDKSQEVSPEGGVVAAAAEEDAVATPPGVVPFAPVSASTGKPFDELSPVRENNNNNGNESNRPVEAEDNHAQSANNQEQKAAPATEDTFTVQSVAEKSKAWKDDFTRRLLDAFHVGNGSSSSNNSVTSSGRKLMDLMFSDAENLCRPAASNNSYQDASRHRPLYNEKFAARFLRDMMTHGVELLSWQAPQHGQDWKGRSVVMMMEPGSISSSIQPKLEWSTQAGGTHYEVETTSLPLLSIQSVSTSAEELKEEGEKESDMCFFTITSESGDIYIFEATSPQERDQVTNGLKNVISRLSFHLIVGDVAAVSELAPDETWTNDPLKLSKRHTTSKTGVPVSEPNQTMNLLANTLLA